MPAPSVTSFIAIRRSLFWLGVGCTLLLIYASIVPLQYTPLSWEDSMQRWQSIPWLELGLYSRADWVANGLVVMPSAFLLSGAILWKRLRHPLAWLLSILMVLALCALVYAIECVQVWFPPRTVSQNDIYAGMVGAWLGWLGWLMTGNLCCNELLRFMEMESVPKRLRFVTFVACLGCVAYSLFPFDLVLSLGELNEKLQLNRLSLGLPNGKIGNMEFAKGLVVSFAKVFPFGAWLGLGRRRPYDLFLLLLIASLLELIQIPIFSKYATLPEAVAGLAGGVVGYYLVLRFSSWSKLLGSKTLAILGIAAWTCVVLAMFNLRFDQVVSEPSVAALRWREFFTPPLLRYYYTSEYSALSNLAGKMIVFATLGVWLAIIEYFQMRQPSRVLFWFGLLLTVGLGIAIETMQVYLMPLVADATDIAIYACGYLIGIVLTRIVLTSKTASSSPSPNGSHPKTDSIASTSLEPSS